MPYICTSCGNTKSFYGVGAVSVTVNFNGNGEVTEIEDPPLKGIGAEVETCGVCNEDTVECREEL